MNKQWKWAIRVVSYCILAPIVLFVTHFGVRSYAENSGVRVASRFLETLRHHDYVTARALMAPSEQTVISATALQRAQEQIEKKHGLWVSPVNCNERHPDDALDRINYFYPTRDDGVTYFYSVETKLDGGMEIMVRAVRTDDGWRVLEYQYDDGPARGDGNNVTRTRNPGLLKGDCPPARI